MSTTIVAVKFTQIPTLNRLFTQAVEQHFTYFPASYRQQVIRDHRSLKLLLAVLNPRRILLTAYHDGELIGYAIGSVPQDGVGQLYWLYVEPQRRGENTGLALLSRMLKLQQQKGATEVVLATHDHRRYYERQGFKRVDTRTVDGVSIDIMSFRMRR